ncbi:MAG: ABC transporter ATP-binding protein [Rhodobacteraceae bacterium]|nr:ABC transporter ATP-binding protein [Paracoccaceae bacterium]
MTVQPAIDGFLRFFDGRQRREIVWLTAATSVASVLEVCGIFLVIPLIRMLHSPAWIHEADLLEAIYTGLHFGSERAFIIAFTALTLGIFLLKNLYLIAVYRWQRAFADRGTRELTDRMLRAYFFGRYEAVTDQNISVAIRKMRDLTPQINRGVALGVVNVAAEVISTVGIVAALVFVELRTALVVGAVAVAIIFILYRTVGARQRRDQADQVAGTQGANRLWGDSLAAMTEIRLMGREDYYMNLLNAAFSRDSARAGARQLVNQSMRPISEIVMLFGITAVVTAVVLTSAPGQSLASLGVLTLVTIRLLPSLNRLSRGATGIRAGFPALAAYLETVNRLEDDPWAGAAAEGKGAPTTFDREVRFENVTYDYPGAKSPALAIPDLTILPGDVVAAVGPSGSGKSTFVSLLLGLRRPTGGRILIDGKDMAGVRTGWQAMIGYVPQDVVILDDTVRRNVALGIADQDIDDARVREVLSIAGLGGRIEKAPNWIDVPLGENGSRLSAGQKQRIGIARALYRDPEVLVLDEATRDIDNRQQRGILRNLTEMPGRRTFILVTHDLSIAQHCKRIVFSGMAGSRMSVHSRICHPAIRHFEISSGSAGLAARSLRTHPRRRQTARKGISS